MKRIFIIQIILLFGANVVAQNELKKKGNSSEFLAESYFVLKSKKSVKEGAYELKIKNGHQIRESILIKGQYANSNAVENWNYYNAFGDLNYTIDASTNKLVQFSPVDSDLIVWSYGKPKNSQYRGMAFYGGKIVPSLTYYEKEYDVIINNEKLQTKLEQPPLFIGSSLVYQLELMEMLNECTKSFNSPSISLLSFIIDSDGNERDFKVQVYSSKNYEDKFMQLLKEKNHKWIPATLKGKNVAIEMVIPIVIMPGNQNDPELHNYYITFSSPEIINYSLSLKEEKVKHIAGWLFESL